MESRRDSVLAGALRRISSISAPKDAIEALEQWASSLLHNDLVPYQGPASSKPAASHDGAAAGDPINLRNSIAAEADALLAGTPASYVMYACTAAGTGPSNTTPLALGISLTL